MFLKYFISFLVSISLCSSIYAQSPEAYAANWKKVEGFEKKGLTNSALQEVLKIYDLALKAGNNAQQVKAAMYQVKYRNMVEEDGAENNIFFIDTLIAKATIPTKNILQSMQAEMFWTYLQNNRWKFSSRTKLSEEKSKDIRTWSLDKLHATISGLYKASLQNETILKNTRLEGYEPILVKGENTRQLRPTLYDFLAHRALAYFMTDESDLTKPAYQFILNDPKIFSPAAAFVTAAFKTNDTGSLHHKALLIFQDILKFHLNDAKPDALIDADLLRLYFVKQYAVITDKEKLYEAALKQVEERYATNPAATQAMYLRAQMYFDRGQEYRPLVKTENQYEIKRAKELAEKAVAAFPRSEGGINAQNLLLQIKLPFLNLETEQVNLPSQPFRTLVKYKNVPAIYLRVIKISREDLNRNNRRNYEKLWSDYVSMKPLKSWSVALPDLQDHQTHAAEIKIDALANGIYMILASIDPDFSLKNNIIARQVTYMSKISYVHNNKQDYYVLDRENGSPLANAQVQTWETKYNYQSSSNEEVKAEKYVTDKNGYFKLKDSKEYRNFLLQVTHNGDELFVEEQNYTYNYNSYEPVLKPTSFLFADRSIYRPGQTVYFKGIVVQQNKEAKKTVILPNYKTSIVLRDANGQRVAGIFVTTNEFGSYKGSFKLPEGLLNGEFNIADSLTNANLFFSVEEYKRPKFFVEINKPTGTFRVNDSVRVTGTAKAYAGNNIDGATVKYRVVRKVRYPIWWDYGFYGRGKSTWPPGRNEETEIANGFAKTDAKGEFIINFKAMPDESVDKKTQPIFYYEVSTDITDLNGETRSGNTTVAVAYQMLQLNISSSEKILTDSFTSIKLLSTNLNDVFEKARVNVSIYKIVSPTRIFRARYWEMPDQFVMSREEYYGYFPHDVYKDEDQMNKWPLGDKMYDQTDSTKADGFWKITGKWQSGWYKVIASTKDKYGEEVKTEKFIRLYSNNLNEKISTPVEVNVLKGKAEPGEQIQYNIQTGFDNIWLIHTKSTINAKDGTSYENLSNTSPVKHFFPVYEDYRGGAAMSYAFVKNNRVYSGSESFVIPWSNKELTISYETFRDKILPGSEEKWKMKISGSKGDKAVAEIMAGMYDASLDQFKPHSWTLPDLWPSLTNAVSWTGNNFKAVQSEEYSKRDNLGIALLPKSYDQLLNLYGSYDRYQYSYQRNGIPMPAPMATSANEALAGKVAGVNVQSAKGRNSKDLLSDEEKSSDSAQKLDDKKITSAPSPNVQVRKNFNETAFFFPDLKTDAEGNVTFSFTIPEALTQWKLMTLAHTKDLAMGYLEKTVTTQKPLMVQPNAPRFLREGDAMEYTVKIVNMEAKELTGTATLELLDAATNKPVDGWFKNVFPNQYFTVPAGQSVLVKFPMTVPYLFNSALTYRVIAKAGNFSDGEEMAIPVLTNRMLVTETMPLNLRNQDSKSFKFEKLLNSGNGNSLSHHALTVEYSSNPAWYAVQALPYLMESTNECSEQVFNRYYANVLAAHLTNSIPKIKAIFEKWKFSDTAALLSNLQKNQELKAVLLEETPWVLAAQNESQQKKNIALLFDMVKMNGELTKNMNKLKEMQSSNGGFVWFIGGPDDRYMTQYILTGLGRLKKLGAFTSLDSKQLKDIKSIVDKGIIYQDRKIREDYENLLRYKSNLKNNNLSYTAVNYLYMRSFFTEYNIPAASQTAYNYYRGQAQKFWLANSKYMQAMIAVSLQRTGDSKTPASIIRSLKENAIIKEEMGMYWKEWTTGGYYWHQAPIESQAMMIEAFTEIDKNKATIDDLKTWLLKQKQTQNWKTTKATADACYALLSGGSSWLMEEKEVTVNLGNMIIKSSDDKTEAGTGYFKKRIEGEKVQPSMGNIKVSLNAAGSKPLTTSSTTWGAVYWQYFEDLDKISSAETPLKLNKKLFIERNSPTGPVLVALSEGATLKVGDKIKVRIELRVDRDMEYVHMKDMRAACMEPVNVISQYKYQGGLGYYETTKDASTNFYFGWLARGTYVFEYPMFVTHAGDFSNGITSIQSMYAPEFSSHSEGVRVRVD